MIDLRLSRIGTVGTGFIGMGTTTPIYGFNSHSALVCVFSSPDPLVFSPLSLSLSLSLSISLSLSTPLFFPPLPPSPFSFL